MLSEYEIEKLKRTITLLKFAKYLSAYEIELLNKLLTSYHKLKRFKLASTLSTPPTEYDEFDHLA